MNKKTLFTIIIILFVLAGASLAVYNLVLKTDEGPGSRETPDNEEALLTPKPISHDRAMALSLDQDQTSIKYYLSRNGHVVSSDFEGQDFREISSDTLPGLKRVIWSPDAKKVISLFEQQGISKKYSFDHETRKASLLSGNIKSIVWSPDSQKIAYHYKTEDGQFNNVSVANPDGSDWHSVFQTRLENLIIDWPSPNKLFVTNAASSQDEGFLFSVEPSSGKFTKILSGVWGLQTKFSPDGQKFIWSAADQNGKNLKLYVAQSDASQPKELPVKTLAQKCVWSPDNQVIFCAVPKEISEYETWPDDYLAGQLLVADDFYLIDAASQEETKIAQSDDGQSFDAESLLLSPEGDYLFFINRPDGLVWNIKLGTN